MAMCVYLNAQFLELGVSFSWWESHVSQESSLLLGHCEKWMIRTSFYFPKGGEVDWVEVEKGHYVVGCWERGFGRGVCGAGWGWHRKLVGLYMAFAEDLTQFFSILSANHGRNSLNCKISQLSYFQRTGWSDCSVWMRIRWEGTNSLHFRTRLKSRWNSM